MTTEKLTINDIKREMRADGSHWWDPDTMRFFGTRVVGPVYQGEGGIYFVTSEKPPHGPRGYTVRQYDPDEKQIETIGEVCGWPDSDEAKDEAKRLAGGEVTEECEKLVEVTEAEQFHDDCRKHGRADVTAKQTLALMDLAKRWRKEKVNECNIANYHADEKLRDRVIEAGKNCGAVGLLLDGDPRGCTVKLVWRDGETNDWGKEGWCVPGA